MYIKSRYGIVLKKWCVCVQGRLALCACTHRFLTVAEDGRLLAASEKAQEREILTVSVLCILNRFVVNTSVECQVL